MTNQEHSEMMAELAIADIQTLESLQREAVWMWEHSTGEKRAYYKELAETANKLLNAGAQNVG